jgi:glyoxylase-like metal-dependent hydrolase (beta-lactamase superfamily II)
VGGDLRHKGRPIYTPFVASVERIELAYNNVYHVRNGSEAVLIDTGPDYAGAAERLEAAVLSAPELVVATHGHLDHAGLGAYWSRRGVPVAVGARDAHLARMPALADAREFADMVAFVRTAGAPPAVAVEVEAGLLQRREWARVAAANQAHPPARTGARWPTGLRFERFEPARLLQGDESLAAQLRVLMCPGHTPANLVLVDESEGWLFSGDQLLPEITPTPAIQHLPPAQAGAQDWRFRSLPAFAASLRDLRKHQFVRCFPGHGEPFDNVADVIDGNLSQIEERTEKVAAALRNRGICSLYALADDLYPRALRRRFWQIIATVQGHLDVLEDAGRATLTDGNYAATNAT